MYFVYEAMEDHGGVHRNFGCPAPRPFHYERTRKHTPFLLACPLAGPYPELAAKQLLFIEADLIKAHANRAQRPWIVAYGHRPMYCSDSDDDDCVRMLNQWRHDLENLFYKYGVDIVFEAHQHTYERLWPTYNATVLNSSSADDPYRQPLAPVHIVAGAAGCAEDLDTFGPPLGGWSAVRIAEYGYGYLTIENHTHAHWAQVDASGEVVLDAITIISDHTRFGIAAREAE